MKKTRIYQFCIHGPRFLMLLIFGLAITGKLTNPSSFYTIVSAFNTPTYVPEILFSSFLTVELLMVWLLAFKPDAGIIYSAILLLFFTIIIGVLHAIGIRELCGNQDVLINEVGPAKVLQNTGMALLLFTSWSMRKDNNLSS